MNPYELSTSLRVGDVDYPIRTDFRDVLYLLQILSSPEYEADEKGAIALRVLYETWEDIPRERYDEALERAAEFIDGGLRGGQKRPGPRTMDWEQDACIILPAVNRVLGGEVRAMPYLHWWTFLGAYMEIGESLFSTVLSVRDKRARGRKLETWEQEFYKANRALIELKKPETEADKARRAALKELFV